jgi:D-threo-aldose 1-dehydrogenase
MRSAEEVHRNLAAFTKQVPERLWTDLAAAGLIDERAPQATP